MQICHRDVATHCEISAEQKPPVVSDGRGSSWNDVAVEQFPGLDDVVTVARAHAARVDDDAVFPHEAVEALRASGLMGRFAPREEGGAGCDLHDYAGVAQALAAACMSTASIWTMHAFQVEHAGPVRDTPSSAATCAGGSARARPTSHRSPPSPAAAPTCSAPRRRCSPRAAEAPVAPTRRKRSSGVRPRW